MRNGLRGTGRRVRVGVAIALIAALTAACGGGGGGASDEGPIKIGVVLSLTGVFGPSAKYVREGYEYWAKEVNDAGGIDGRKVKLVVRDDQSKPAVAATLARSLVDKDDVFMILGPYGSGATDTMGAALEQSQVPMLATIGSDSAIWDRRKLTWTFQAFPSSTYDHEAFLHVAEEEGAKRVTIINEEAGFSVAAAKWAKAEAKKSGMEVQSLSYPSESHDFSSIVQKMKGFKPDAVSMGGYYEASVALTKEMISAGLDVPGYHFIQAADGVTAEALGKDADGIIGRSSWEPQLETAKNEEFAAGYEKQFERAPSYHSAAAYASGEVTQAAIEAGGTDREKVREFFATKTVDTVQGTYDVNEKGQQTGYKYVGIQWRGEEKVVIWPDDQATDEVVWPKRKWA